MPTPVVVLVLTGHVSGETWQGSAAQMRRETWWRSDRWPVGSTVYYLLSG